MADDKPGNPLRAIMDIRRAELPLALLMFTYFFSVITTFWVLKPIKKDVLVNFYGDDNPFNFLGWSLGGPEAELFAKLINMAVAAGAVVIFSWLSRYVKRHRLTLIFCALFSAGFLAYWGVLGSGSAWVAWTFYLYGDLWSTVMVATFFAFLNDSVKPEAARRLYGLIILGGVAGGAFGTSFLRVWIDDFAYSFWMLVCIGITAVIGAVAVGAGLRVERGKDPAARAEAAKPGAGEQRQGQKKEESEEEEQADEQETDGNPALAGAKLVARSRYLLAIVAIVGMYEIVSTILDYQFTKTIVHFVPEAERGEQFALVYNISNVGALAVQVLFTGLLMSRFKLSIPLLVTPIAILCGSAAFLVFPLLWPGSLLSVWDNALNYSVNQSAREALYTPTSRAAKYQAKAFIDMFVQRFAKGLAVGLALLMKAIFDSYSGVRWLSFATVALVAVWILAARYAGRRFHDLAGQGKKVTESGQEDDREGDGNGDGEGGEGQDGESAEAPSSR